MGVVLDDDRGRRPGAGGAGPSDHRAVSLGGSTVMVPLRPAGRSPLPPAGARPGRGRAHAAAARRPAHSGLEVELPATPRFYALHHRGRHPLHEDRSAAQPPGAGLDGLQTCVRYNDPETACQFCAIGTSLAEGRTLARKTPAQLAEVAAGGGTPRRHRAGGADHRHAGHARPGSGAPGGLHRRHQARGARAAGAGPVRAARRLRLVRAPARRRALTRWACTSKRSSPRCGPR